MRSKIMFKFNIPPTSNICKKMNLFSAIVAMHDFNLDT